MTATSLFVCTSSSFLFFLFRWVDDERNTKTVTHQLRLSAALRAPHNARRPAEHTHTHTHTHTSTQTQTQTKQPCRSRTSSCHRLFLPEDPPHAPGRHSSACPSASRCEPAHTWVYPRSLLGERDKVERVAEAARKGGSQGGERKGEGGRAGVRHLKGVRVRHVCAVALGRPGR